MGLGVGVSDSDFDGTGTWPEFHSLTRILDRYLSALECGAPHDPAALVREHPDLAHALELYLDSLAELQSISAGFDGHADSADTAIENANDPRRLGDFLLGRELGRGGMGVVFEARQVSLDRRVALKVLPFAAVLDSKQITRFKNEAQATAQIHHPHIVPIFAIGVERGVHYYAMQLIDGRPLDEAIRELRRLARPSADSDCQDDRTAGLVERAILDLCPSSGGSCLPFDAADRREYFKAVIRIGIDVAGALHAAHEYGVVHRDIKPSNLLLDRDGKIWVTDFGLARCQNNVTLTRTGDVVGTMRYMSPEQARGETAMVDHRTDVYSLAVTLYELLTLQPVVGAEDEPAGPRAVERCEPKPLRRICPEIPVDLETVVMKAMARDRDDRYLTAEEFAVDLRRVLEGKPTAAKPPSVPERVSKWARRHRRVVIVAAGVCLCAVLGSALSTFLIAREKSRAEDNFERAERRLRDAHDVVDRFGARLAEKLAHLNGAEGLRREVLEDALAYYRDFVREAGDDPTLQHDLALTYSKMGVLADQIGATDAAIEAHERALELFRKLVAAEPHATEYQRLLAMCHNNMALTLRRAGRVADAQEAYRSAIRLQQGVLRSAPGKQAVSDLALSHTNLGLLKTETNQMDAAVASFGEAIRYQEQLQATDPRDADTRRKLAASYNNLGAVYLANDPHKAAECYRVALVHQDEAVALNPRDPQLQGDLALTCTNLGAALSRTEEFPGAVAAYEKAVEIQQRLVAAAPAQKAYRRDLAVSHNNRGLMQSRLGALADAEQSFTRALELHETLVTQYPEDLDLQSSLGGVHNNRGFVLEQLQRVEDAAVAYKQAVEHQRIAFTRAPDVLQYREFLARHYCNYGRALRQLGHADQAVRAALARRELWPRDGQRLFAIAEELAAVGAGLTKTNDSQLTGPQCEALTVETLQQAVAAGFQLPADLSARPSFAWLKDHDGFAGLIGTRWTAK